MVTILGAESQRVTAKIISDDLPKSKSFAAETKFIRYRDPSVELDHRGHQDGWFTSTISHFYVFREGETLRG